MLSWQWRAGRYQPTKEGELRGHWTWMVVVQAVLWQSAVQLAPGLGDRAESDFLPQQSHPTAPLHPGPFNDDHSTDTTQVMPLFRCSHSPAENEFQSPIFQARRHMTAPRRPIPHSTSSPAVDIGSRLQSPKPPPPPPLAHLNSPAVCTFIPPLPLPPRHILSDVAANP